MVIRTDTTELRSLRQEILKLLLSEHPASCLFCEEHDECKEFQGTIRKVGVTTGCRYCPNDARCELQEITEKVGLTETSYPVYYRGFSVEKYDPFYDRDYNLCILCGRCVRVCNSVRLNGTLSFKQRGKLTTIGPAFDRTHLEAGCEFCGACVSVCPTGALSAKVSKWYGKPDTQVTTTCVYCPVGCRLELQVKNNEVIDVLPNYDSPIDQGLICVKGRFAIPEYVLSPERLGTPSRLTPVGYEVISWDQAIDEAAKRLRGTKPEDKLVMVSPQLSNEDLFVAQQFTREVLGSDVVISSMMIDLGDDLVPFLELVTTTSTFDTIEDARGVLAVGFDSTYGYSPVGIRIKKAGREGALLVTLGACDSNLDMLSETAFQMEPPQWAEFLGSLVDYLARGGKGKVKVRKEWTSDIERISRIFSDSSTNILVIGQEAIFSPGRREIFEKARTLRDKLGWKIIVAHPYTNLLGMLAMGAFPGAKPGEFLKNGDAVTVDLPVIDLAKRKKVVYLIGEGRFDTIPDCDYLIYQNGLPPVASRQPDLILPASLFTESSGTTTNGEGRVLKIEKATEPFMDAKPDWWIFNRIAEKLNKGKLKYKDVAAVQTAIKKQVKGFYGGRKPVEFARINAERATKWLRGAPKQEGQSSGAGNNPSYRGIPLARVVAGMKAIDEWVNTSLLSDKEAQ
ncbi:MAG: putative formate dehydrogenase [Syntrophorhabdus sp. PtaU1.Bin002]|nr:MAG: putative formate dehydrogenase [Syntrophorhabdus sp. PtaU1.Bin002]